MQLNADPDIAQLQALTAEANLAGLTYHRDLIQYQAQAIGKAQLDTDAADLKSTQEQEAAQAALVAKKTVRAPFSGRLGITTVNPGQYLNPGDKIVTLESVDPIYVDFRAAAGRTWRESPWARPCIVTADAFPRQRLRGEDHLDRSAGRSVHPQLPGRGDRPQSRAQAAARDVRAHDGRCRARKQRYLTLPQTAITYNPYGETVFLVRQPATAGGHPTAQLVFVTRRPDARRPGGRRQGPQGRATSS